LLFRPKETLSRLRTEREIGAVRGRHIFKEKQLERTATHGWVAKFFYEIFAVGANWADKVGQVKAILIAQRGCYESQELRVGYGHESCLPIQTIQNSNINLISARSYQLHNKMALAPSLRPLLIAGKPDAPHTLDIFRM
jgi:hypothetical protein